MDVMHKNLSKTFKALHWEQAQVVLFHALKNSHSSAVCCCTAAGWLSGCCTRQNAQNPYPAARKWPELGFWIRSDRHSHSFPSQPQPARVKFFIKAHEQLNVPWAATRAKLFCSDTIFWELHSCTVSSHRSKDFPVSLKCARKSVLPSILSQTEPGTDTYHKGVKEKMQSLHRLPLALPFVCGVPEVDEVKKLHPADESSHKHTNLLEQFEFHWYLLS